MQLPLARCPAVFSTNCSWGRRNFGQNGMHGVACVRRKVHRISTVYGRTAAACERPVCRVLDKRRARSACARRSRHPRRGDCRCRRTMDVRGWQGQAGCQCCEAVHSWPTGLLLDAVVQLLHTTENHQTITDPEFHTVFAL